MGRFDIAQPGTVKPSQDFLKEGTVAFILECYRNSDPKNLPPEPVVRIDPRDGKMIAIDGHNLFSVKDQKGEPTRIYIAESADDVLKKEQFPNATEEAIAERNRELREKFDKAIEWSDKLKEQGIGSFSDLNKKYEHLFESESHNEFKLK